MKYRAVLFTMTLSLIAAPAFAATLTVGCGGDYASIQAAVSAANPYDTITVCPGDYNESVLIQTEGLTIQSTEVSERGPNTSVNRFAIGFAPNFGPHSVTILGFNVDGPAGVCIESSGDYSTIAFNRVSGCTGDAAVRVNAGNVYNNVHHNLVEDNSKAGIVIEGNSGCEPGRWHNVHQNMIVNNATSGSGEGCLYVWADDTEVHQNQIGGVCGNGGINANGSESLHIFQNEVCSSIELWGADYAYVHHNLLTGSINNENSDDTLRKNRENLSSCPFVVPTP
jgi:hypothetical protein